mgnify:CR=1 FL=1
MSNVLVLLGDHGSTPVPPAVSDDMNLGSQERVGGPNDRANVHVVLEVFDSDMEGVPTRIQVGDDGLHRPEPIAIDHIARVAVAQELGVQSLIHAGTLIPGNERAKP